MRNEIIYDAAGVPDVMVVFTPDELGLPATIKGRKVAEYLIGKYQATLIGGVPHSLPYQKPAVDINHDEAIRLCENKGEGWHLFTNDEWAALAHWSRKNGTLPRGNTNSGKSHSHPEETGTTYEGSYGKTLTGSGSVTWNHDHTAEGVADMVGNVWEHVGGIRFLNGQVQTIPNNEAAAGADQSKDSKEWTAIYTSDGDPIYYNPIDGEIFVQPHEATEKDYDGDCFTNLHASELDVPDRLIELGLYPAPGYDSEEYFWVDNDGERVIYRGGGWYIGTNAGVFYLFGNDSRASSDTSIGFRPALIRYSEDSGNLDNLDPENAERQPEDYDPFVTLPGLVREILAGQLAKLCRYTEPKQLHEITMKVLEADQTELRELGQLLPALAQTAAAVEVYESVTQQAKLVATTSITIEKEGNHE